MKASTVIHMVKYSRGKSRGRNKWSTRRTLFFIVAAATIVSCMVMFKKSESSSEVDVSRRRGENADVLVDFEGKADKMADVYEDWSDVTSDAYLEETHDVHKLKRMYAMRHQRNKG